MQNCRTGRNHLANNVCCDWTSPRLGQVSVVSCRQLWLTQPKKPPSSPSCLMTSSALSYIPQQGHGSSLEIECVLSNKCDNPRWFLPPQSGEQFVESGPKILHIWDPLHAVSTWKICIIFNLMGEFQLLQLSQCSCSWNVCKQIW